MAESADTGSISGNGRGVCVQDPGIAIHEQGGLWDGFKEGVKKLQRTYVAFARPAKGGEVKPLSGGLKQRELPVAVDDPPGFRSGGKEKNFPSGTRKPVQHRLQPRPCLWREKEGLKWLMDSLFPLPPQELLRPLAPVHDA